MVRFCGDTFYASLLGAAGLHWIGQNPSPQCSVTIQLSSAKLFRGNFTWLCLSVVGSIMVSAQHSSARRVHMKSLILAVLAATLVSTNVYALGKREEGYLSVLVQQFSLTL